MKSKGFTLVELLATISIIGIIIAIAVPSYINLSASVKHKTYDNKISVIVSKAKVYASDNSIDNETITVQYLIKAGYLTPEKDTENEQIVNPLGGYLDCYIVSINKEETDYNVEVTPGDTCDLTANDLESAKVNVKGYTNSNGVIGDEVLSDTWTNQNLILYGDFNAASDDIIGDTIKWTMGTTTQSKNGAKINGASINYQNYSNEILVAPTLFLNSIYVMNVNINDELVNKKYLVKIDKEKPYLNATVSDAWSNSTKTVTLIGSDGNGSGIKGFYISTTKDMPNIANFSNDISVTEGKANVSLDAGTYYAYTIDNANNISEPYDLVVSNVDKEGATCKYPVIPNKWTNQDITITYGCSDDSQTGCKTADTTKTYMDDTTEVINWDIEDNIGNVTNCSTGSSVHILIDKVVPTIKAKENPLIIDKRDYAFTSNLDTTCGSSGCTITCNPAISKKTGEYNVTCTITNNAGISASTTFNVSHHYAASDSSFTCPKCSSYQCNQDSYTYYYISEHHHETFNHFTDYENHCYAVVINSTISGTKYNYDKFGSLTSSTPIYWNGTRDDNGCGINEDNSGVFSQNFNKDYNTSEWGNCCNGSCSQSSCSSTCHYYTCPKGGTLSGTTCYY
jgi:prepilin-type N-terminal cleavage/methylation domain-containing protein